MSHLFSPIRLGGVSLSNRIVIPPMCQYSAVEGVPQFWHHQHLGSLALSGASLLIMEATGVEPAGRITPGDTGLWSDTQEAEFARIIAGIRTFSDVKLGVQLAHAGRKSSTTAPWIDQGRALKPEEGAWTTYAPSALSFRDDWHTPEALDEAGLARICDAFVASAKRADRVGFDLVELHGAHGYLLTQFLSPLSNTRTDQYGGSLENRMRFPLEIATAVRAVWPAHKALGMRLNGSDWTEGGITVDEAVAFSRELKVLGFDYVHLTSGGNVAKAKIPGDQPGYQVPFAAAVKKAVPDLPVIAVGLIADPHQAETILADGDADLIALARAVLDDPRWPWRAALALGEPEPTPVQYQRATAKAWPAGYKLAHGS